MKPKTPFGFGVLFVLVGAFFFAVALSLKPLDRSTFKTVEGIVDNGTKTTVGKDKVMFRLTIVLGPASVQYLDLDPGQTSQEKLEGVIGKRVTAEVDGSTCYVLTCNGEPVVTYEQSTESIAESANTNKRYAAIGMGLGVVICAIGLIRGRKAAAAKQPLAPAVA